MIFACSSSDDDNSSICDNISTDGEELFENLITSSLAYFDTPTSASCIDFKNAIEAYVIYGNGIKDCLNSEDRAKLEAEINEFETELAALNCA